VGRRLCLAVAWAAWTIKATPNGYNEGLEFIPGLFLVPSNKFFGLLPTSVKSQKRKVPRT
jgi:hypothetical protein